MSSEGLRSRDTAREVEWLQGTICTVAASLEVCTISRSGALFHGAGAAEDDDDSGVRKVKWESA